eukprot:1241829-Amphidinium_carterae.1
MQRKQFPGCATLALVTFKRFFLDIHAFCEAGTLRLAERLSTDRDIGVILPRQLHALMMTGERESSQTRKPSAAAVLCLD